MFEKKPLADDFGSLSLSLSFLIHGYLVDSFGLCDGLGPFESYSSI